ncbi:MAG TPA: GFA family protein [Steroidobacteraceae bacterium]|jgi:hypothetical protein|nr:GFA family protein [Steroidobacteraceae bacterium]
MSDAMSRGGQEAAGGDLPAADSSSRQHDEHDAQSRQGEDSPPADVAPRQEYWLTGQCHCRTITFACVAPPTSINYCHCTQCRRAVGGPFAVLAWFSSQAVRGNLFSAPSRRSSSIATRGFCRDCGTPLYLRYDQSDEIGILVGVFDEPETLRPSHHYGIESRLPWVDCGAGLPGKETEEKPAPPAA